MIYSSRSTTFALGFCLLLSLSLLSACSGKVRTIDGPDDETPSGGSGGGPIDATGGFGVGGTGGGTGGMPEDPYIEPECPDEDPPPVYSECDPFAPESGCLDGDGCYPYLDYPYGEGCGHASYGTICVPASTGEQGEFCGDNGTYCAPGYMCVVGAAGGKRCGKICQPVKDHGCPDGLICGETDIQGYGVCF